MAGIIIIVVQACLCEAMLPLTVQVEELMLRSLQYRLEQWSSHSKIDNGKGSCPMAGRPGAYQLTSGNSGNKYRACPM